MNKKLVRDPFQCNLWIWKICVCKEGIDSWLDCSPTFFSRRMAIQWMEDKE